MTTAKASEAPAPKHSHTPVRKKDAIKKKYLKERKISSEDSEGEIVSPAEGVDAVSEDGGMHKLAEVDGERLPPKSKRPRKHRA